MTALLRYRAAILLRSHRWAFPVAGGAVLGLAGVGYELATSGGLHRLAARGTLLPSIGTGLSVAFVCLLVGSAVGALFNTPVIRHPTVALLGTVAAVVAGLVSGVSPAKAALRGNGATLQSAPWPTGVPVLAAVGLVVICWALSCVLAAVRGD